jgi:hypothetical protein
VVASFSTWALRTANGERQALSDERIAEWTRWGLLRVPPEGGWTEQDIERTVQIRDLAKTVRSLPRRAIRLYDARHPTEPSKLREAMIAVVPAIKRAMHKMWQVDDALRTHREGANASRSQRQRRSTRWRLPVQDWAQVLGRFADEEFERIAASASTDARALMQSPAVVKSGDVKGIPFEELVILLTVRQLAMSDLLKARSQT